MNVRVVGAEATTPVPKQYRLYTFASDGRLKRLNADFHPGDLIEAVAGDQVACFAASGEGNLHFPDATTHSSSFALTAKIGDEGIVNEPIPVLFGGRSLVTEDNSCQLELECRTAMLRFR